MLDKSCHIDATRRYVGWAYPDLTWFTPDAAQRATRRRDALVASLSGGVQCAFKKTKLHTGALSPGCRTCGEGTWSCLMIGSRCTADCFFCPQDRRATTDKPPTAGGIEFSDPDDYVDYLDVFGLKGVGISGGEPLLLFDKALSFLKAIRNRFGPEIYVWLYTNGDLATEEKLDRLKSGGLDEIRFDIVHRGYDLDVVEAACDRLDTVAVEVPAIPEDGETVQRCLPEMQRIGVAHLNLHQLHATAHNYKRLSKRGYTFLHYPSEYPVPVFESEMTALELLRHAIDSRLALPINYCSHAFKYRFQNAGARRRAAVLGCEGFEGITEAGYIRRLTLKGPAADIQEAVKRLAQGRAPQERWSADPSRAELSIHHSLLPDLAGIIDELTVRYFDVRTNTQGQHPVALNANRSLYVERRLLAIEALAAGDVQSFRAAFLGDEGDEPHDASGRRSLDAFAMWERIEEGLPEVY